MVRRRSAAALRLRPREPHETQFLTTCVNPPRDEAYFYHGRQLTAIDLVSLATRVLWETPEGFRRSMINCAADGKYIYAGVFEDLSHRLRIDYGRGYVGFPETWEAQPESRIYRVAVDGAGAGVVWKEQCWIGHVNTSPTQPQLITFCHEGPWIKVDNRIWGLDIDKGKPWKIRAREHPDERVGHEYWYADGVHLGYHGQRPDKTGFLGTIKYDNTERLEADFASETGHIHSNDRSLIVGDGGSVIRIWKWNGTGYDGPRILAEHRSSMHIQKVHAHPRFTPDGTKVLYTSDVSGYGNVYLAEVPDFESLPELDEG